MRSKKSGEGREGKNKETEGKERKNANLKLYCRLQCLSQETPFIVCKDKLLGLSITSQVLFTYHS